MNHSISFVAAMTFAFLAVVAIGQVSTSAPPGTISAQPPPSSGVVNRNRVLPPVLKAPMSPAMSNQLAASWSNSVSSNNQFAVNSNRLKEGNNLAPTGSASGTNQSHTPP